MARAGRSGRCTSVQKLGVIVIDNPRLSNVIKYLLDSEYKWVSVREVREFAGLGLDKESVCAWQKFSRNALSDGYLENRRDPSTQGHNHYIRVTEGGMAKLQHVLEWVST